MKKLYDVNPPIHMRSALMTHPTFFVPDSADGLKTAAFLDDCSREEKTELFKTAVERGTSDLSDAYVEMKKGLERKDDLEMEETEYDTSDAASFIFPAGTLIENDEEPSDEDADIDETLA